MALQPTFLSFRESIFTFFLLSPLPNTIIMYLINTVTKHKLIGFDMATEAVWYDIFRRITLNVTDDGGIVTTAGTIEADAYKDTLTITGGKGVAFNPDLST